MVRNERGMALLTTLGIMAVLMVLATSFAMSVRSEIRLAGTAINRTSASWLAEAGLQEALLDLRDNPAGYIALAPDAEERGLPLIYTLSSDEDQRSGLSSGAFVVEAFDEAAKVNLNTAEADLLDRLLPYDPALVNAILDWRDPDDSVRDDGAESDYYGSLQDPYQARDNWFETVAELLLVRDVNPARFFGEAGLSPLADPQTVGTADPAMTPLSDLFTVYSADQNVDQFGEQRIDLQTVSRDDLLQSFDGVLTEQDVDAIIAYRDRDTGQSGGSGQGTGGDGEGTGTALTPGQVGAAVGLQPDEAEVLSGLAGAGDESGSGAAGTPAGGGEAEQRPGTVAELLQVVDREKMQQIYDRLTAGQATNPLGLINLNTASEEVLASLPGLDESLASAIVNARREAPFETVGDLLRLTEIENDVFQQLAPFVTTRTLAFRLKATGTVGQGESAWSSTIWAVVVATLAPASSGEESAATESAGPVRTLRLVYRQME